ncbi:hypothetical protein D9758_016859 [Tetrapyrgos nigripes]|uniref:Bacteriophage T5 Orf172 DNA-binding domain-containing protein n=1 Tax=Tetrapyrgos nigripes TaxID=182062 RepID=A0A8H5CER0_9AGAR|nr:hypothetical protein D9758_016859 [Tetrapyrgos nigripes]
MVRARHAKLGLYALATNNPKAFKIGLTTRAFSQRAREWARQCPSEGFQLIYGVNIHRRHLRIAERNAHRKMRTISIPTYRKPCKDSSACRRQHPRIQGSIEAVEEVRSTVRSLNGGSINVVFMYITFWWPAKRLGDGVGLWGHVKLGLLTIGRTFSFKLSLEGIEVLSMFLDNKIDEDCLLRLPPTPKSEYPSSFFAPTP